MDSLYMVKEGMVQQSGSRSSTGSDVQPYSAGDFFGQSALAENLSSDKPTWPGSITAAGDVTLLRLLADEMVDMLGDLSTIMRDNFQQRVLGSIEMFKALNSTEVSVLVDALSEARYVTGDKIINQGDEGDTFFIIKSGTVRVSVSTNGALPGSVSKDHKATAISSLISLPSRSLPAPLASRSKSERLPNSQ